MTREEAKELFETIKANHAALNGCAVHKFPPLTADLRRKYRCENCGGEADAGLVLSYCRGFKAAGGDPCLVCENFE